MYNEVQIVQIVKRITNYFYSLVYLLYKIHNAFYVFFIINNN